jgi:tetratricopeptide (TPR) repeat protein
MKFNKNVFQKLVLITVLGLTPLYANSQNDSLLESFTQSYYYEKVGNYNSAISSLKKVYQADSYECNLRLGWLTYNAGLYQESISFYQKAIDLMPISIQARLGYVYPAAAFGNMTSVITQYKKILEIDPQNTVANYKLGYIYYDKKDFQTAFKYFEKLVNLYPFDYDGLLMYAWTNLQLGKSREATVLFKKVLLLSPGDQSATSGLALLK